MIFIAENGKLSDEGVAFIRTAFPDDASGLDPDEIQDIFNPHSHLSRTRNTMRNRWRQGVIEGEVRSFLEVGPARISGGLIATSGTPRPGFFATSDGSRIVITNRHFSTVFRILLALNSINVSDDTFNIGSLAPLDIRQWSMIRFLVYAIRERNAVGEPNDEIFARTYAKTHVGYLSERFHDPLNLVNPGEIENANLLQESLSLNQFLELADSPYDSGLGGYNYGGSLMGVTDSLVSRAKEWSGFLFPGFLGSLDSSRDGSRALRDCLNNRRATCHDIDLGSSPKLLRRRQPDIIQIFPSEQKIEIIDPTFRWNSRWHNFKSGIYQSILRILFQNVQNESWTVVGLDIKNKRYVTVT